MDALAVAHDAAVQMIDTSIVRVHQHACLHRSQQETVHGPVAGRVSPARYMRWSIAVVCRSGSRSQRVKRTTTGLQRSFLSRLKSGSMLLADRGYDADWIRTLASERGAWANIPPRCNRNEPICFSPHLYRARNLVERFFNKIKQCRRIATRYDKLAANYLAFVQLASIRLWLRVNKFHALIAAK